MTTKTDSELVGASAPADAAPDEPEEGAGQPESATPSDRPPGVDEAAEPRDRAPTGIRRRLRPLTAAVALLVVALCVSLGVAVVALRNDHAAAQARVSALAAARTDAVRLAGYDYRHLGHDFGVVIANSTPSFRRNFTQSSNALRSALTKYHATANARVVSAGLVSSSTSRAVALVFLDQRVTNSTRPSATTDRSQIEITLVRSGDHWLIDQVVLL